MSEANFFQIQSFLIICLMAFGIIKRKDRSLHVKVMSSAIIWDVILILQIELSRSAIAKASKVMTNPMMLKIHLFFAISCVLLYVAMVITGRKLLSGKNEVRKKHKALGLITIVFRLLTFATSFFAVTK